MTIAEMHEHASEFYRSGLFPKLKSQAAAFVIIQAGEELGIPPFAAIKGINIIDGKPEVSPALLAAIIRRGGLYDFRQIELTDDACVLEFFRPGSGEVIGRSPFTQEDATRASLNRDKRHQDGTTSPSMYSKYPRNMLFARALSNGGRWYCPDAAIGSLYSDDEIGDEPAREPSLQQQVDIIHAEREVERERTGEPKYAKLGQAVAAGDIDWLQSERDRLIESGEDPRLIDAAIDSIQSAQADAPQRRGYIPKAERKPRYPKAEPPPPDEHATADGLTLDEISTALHADELHPDRRRELLKAADALIQQMDDRTVARLDARKNLHPELRLIVAERADAVLAPREVKP